MPRIYSYVMVRDYGFAPNPFHGYCTLATCKPQIRNSAESGDLVLGTGSAAQGRSGHLVYCMRVDEALSFQEYWDDERFEAKKPILVGSRRQWYGDNIYRRDDQDQWHQADSHHSKPGGVANDENLRSDTSVDRVLVGTDFAYWGGEGPAMPPTFRSWNGTDLVHSGIGHSCHFPDDLVAEFSRWIVPQLNSGRVGRPRDWS